MRDQFKPVCIARILSLINGRRDPPSGTVPHDCQRIQIGIQREPETKVPWRPPLASCSITKGKPNGEYRVD